MKTQINKLIFSFFLLFIAHATKYRLFSSNNEIDESEYLQRAKFFNDAQRIAVQTSQTIQIISNPKLDLLYTIELESAPWRLFLHPKDNRIFVVLVTGEIAIYDGDNYQFHLNLNIEDGFLSLLVEFNLVKNMLIVGGIEITGNLVLKEFSLEDYQNQNVSVVPIKDCRLDSMSATFDFKHIAMLCEPKGNEQKFAILEVTSLTWIKIDVLELSYLLQEITAIKFNNYNQLLYFTGKNQFNNFVYTLGYDEQKKEFQVSQKKELLLSTTDSTNIHFLSADVSIVSIGKELIFMDPVKLNILSKQTFEIEIVSIDSTKNREFLLISLSNNTHSEIFLEKIVDSSDFSLQKEGPQLFIENFKEIEISEDTLLKALGIILIAAFLNAIFLITSISINFQMNSSENQNKAESSLIGKLTFFEIMKRIKTNRTTFF